MKIYPKNNNPMWTIKELLLLELIYGDNELLVGVL